MLACLQRRQTDDRQRDRDETNQMYATAAATTTIHFLHCHGRNHTHAHSHTYTTINGYRCMQMLSQQTRKSVRMHTHTHTYTNEHLQTHALITQSTHEIWIESKEEHQQIDTAGAAERRRRRIWCVSVYVFCTGVCICMQTCECVATPATLQRETNTYTKYCMLCLCLPACVKTLRIAKSTRGTHATHKRYNNNNTTHTTNACKETVDTKKWKYKWRTRLGE